MVPYEPPHGDIGSHKTKRIFSNEQPQKSIDGMGPTLRMGQRCDDLPREHVRLVHASCPPGQDDGMATSSEAVLGIATTRPKSFIGGFWTSMEGAWRSEVVLCELQG